MFLIPRPQVLTGPPQGGVPELAPAWAGKVRKVIVNGVLPKGIVAGSTISKQTTKFGTSLVQPSRIWNNSVGSQYAINLGTRPNSATFLIIAERNCDCNVEQNIPLIMNCATLGDGGVGIAMGNWWNSPVHRNKVHAGSGDLWIGGVFQSLVPSLSDNELLADTPYTIVNSISTMTGGEYKLFAKDDSAGGYVSPVKLHLFVELDLQSPESAKSLSANPWQIFKRPDSRIFVPVSAGGGSAQTLTPPPHTNSQSFYSPAVSQSSAPQSLTASLFASSSTIFVPTVQASKALSAGLFSNANTPYSPTVTATKTLATSFYSNAQAFYPPAVSVGAVSISPPLYSNTPTFYAHVLNQVGGPQNVVVPLFNNTQTFYSPLLSPGAVSVTPSLYANAQTFYGLTATTSKTLIASLLTNSSELYEPLATLAGGPLVIAPSLFSNTVSFFTHMVASGLVQIYPVRFDSASVFYAPVVSTGSFSGSISDADITRIVQAVLAALNATTIPVDTRKMNGAAIIGTGLVGDDWRGFGVQPQ